MELLANLVGLLHSEMFLNTYRRTINGPEWNGTDPNEFWKKLGKKATLEKHNKNIIKDVLHKIQGNFKSERE